ncbi:MAG: DUF3996 domain-containing protein [Ignavibacteriae bacterium]|nr:DUF3996 domain-containing protein [Ignavibacteriota bacterium]
MRLLPLLLRVAIPAVFLLVPLSESHAQVPPGKRFGVGFSLGEPTAVTIKWRSGPTTAFDFGIGHSFMGYPRVHADYLWQFFYLFPRTEFRLNAYAGIGAAIGFGKKGKYLLFDSQADSSRWYYTHSVSFAARGVIGLNYFIARPGLEFYFEVNPLLGFAPEPALDVEAAFGARLYIY